MTHTGSEGKYVPVIPGPWTSTLPPCRTAAVMYSPGSRWVVIVRGPRPGCAGSTCGGTASGASAAVALARDASQSSVMDGACAALRSLWAPT